MIGRYALLTSLGLWAIPEEYQVEVPGGRRLHQLLQLLSQGTHVSQIYILLSTVCTCVCSLRGSAVPVPRAEI